MNHPAYLVFTKNHDVEKALRRFEQKFGVKPQTHFVDENYLRVGPTPDEHIIPQRAAIVNVQSVRDDLDVPPFAPIVAKQSAPKPCSVCHAQPGKMATGHKRIDGRARIFRGYLCGTCAPKLTEVIWR